MRWLRSAASREFSGVSSLYRPRNFWLVSGNSRLKTCAVASSALSSGVSRVIRRASWSPQTCTHSPHPLQRSLTKMEKMPPLPGFFFSTLRKIAVTSLYASGNWSMMLVNSPRAASETVVS